MPNFPMVSAKKVLAKVIRNTGYKLPSVYHDDILEWIPEAINMLSTTQSLIIKSTPDQNCPGEVYVKNHVACLPYGFASILAVEDERGRRLPEGGDITDLRSTTKLSGARPDDARISTFAVNPLQHQTSDGT